MLRYMTQYNFIQSHLPFFVSTFFQSLDSLISVQFPLIPCVTIKFILPNTYEGSIHST